MSLAIKVRMLLAAKQMTLKELAAKLNTSSQNINGKLSRDNLSEKDLVEIAEACGAKFEGKFVLEDGTEI